MSPTTAIIVGLIVLGGCYGWYAVIISRRNTALEALAGIDVQLTQRSNLIPNILTVAQKFMNHESALLTEIVQLRERTDSAYEPKSAEDVRHHLGAASQLDSQLGRLLVQVEDYPELKSDQTMVTAMQTYNEVEAKIAAARRFYNSATASLNTSVQIFPGSVLARIASVSTMPLYETKEAQRSPIAAADHLK